MQSVLTLIGSKRKAPVTEDLIVAVTAELGRAGLAAGSPQWLCEGEACDLPFAGISASALAAARQVVGPAAIDVTATPAANRRKRLLIADMDSTLIDQECIDELAVEAGIGEHVADITARSMAGELDFEPALRERVGLLKGLPVDVADRVLAERITLKAGGRTLVATMRAAGAHTVLVSGGFTIFAEKIAKMLGIEEFHANRLLHEDGHFTGKVAEPILGRNAKVETLKATLARHNLSAEETIAVGDGANDVGMVAHAGLGVALHGKPALVREADADIRYGDLTALLYLQGYKREEFHEAEAREP
ncbi:phosphoserine phosphatase [Rhodopseudomonas julia]|uniref:Phosphoserine phosphatase n=1 Tax=Rhodopseudomonas julia TaxID=200617 RepID=A0ABU0C854_9BRAD|nr:phosphoserine phosphatase SerB [Rhodopseudomonas julia]MDQ0326699.1 phosphoserine phosphatase [Rhodopseudomonas julia]